MIAANVNVRKVEMMISSPCKDYILIPSASEGLDRMMSVKLTSLAYILVIAWSDSVKMGEILRVSMDINSATLRLTLHIRAGDSVQAVLGTAIWQVSS